MGVLRRAGRVLAVALVMAVSGGRGEAAGAALKRWASAVEQLRSGQHRPKVVLVGDSTTMGMGAGSGPDGTVGASASSPSVAFAQALRQAGLPAVSTSAFGSHGIGADFAAIAAYDPRLTAGPGWGRVGETSSASETFSNTTDRTRLSFSPEGRVDGVDIYFLREQGGGTFTVVLDGKRPLGSAATAGPAATIGKVGFRFKPGRHRIDVQRSGRGGPVEIIGFDAFDSTAPAVSVINLGWAGSTSADHAKYLPQGLYAALKPDLVVIDLGINDARMAIPPDVFRSNIRQLIAVAEGSGDVLLTTPILGSRDTAHPELYSAYDAELASLAKADACGFYDQNGRFGISNGSGPPETRAGFFRPDAVHLTASGYQQKGEALAAEVLDLSR